MSLWLNTPLKMYGVRRTCSAALESLSTLPITATRCPEK